MPTYEYVCKACGHRLEVIQSMTEPPLTVCPECGGELRKVFAPPAISFKGSGFYSTDHAKRTAKEAPAAKDSNDSKGGSSDKQKDGARADRPAEKKKESASKESPS
jgi:putative FmdB family regulatory protein